jgi:hypothetical protein
MWRIHKALQQLHFHDSSFLPYHLTFVSSETIVSDFRALRLHKVYKALFGFESLSSCKGRRNHFAPQPSGTTFGKPTTMSTHPDVAKAADVEPATVQTTYIRGKSDDYGRDVASAEETRSGASHTGAEPAPVTSKREWFGYFKTKQFWILLLAGSVLCMLKRDLN